MTSVDILYNVTNFWLTNLHLQLCVSPVANEVCRVCLLLVRVYVEGESFAQTCSLQVQDLSSIDVTMQPPTLR